MYKSGVEGTFMIQLGMARNMFANCCGEEMVFVHFDEPFLLAFLFSLGHKVHIYKKYHSVCPLLGIGTLPPPLSPAGILACG
jgi:hypothetical protein